MTFPSRVRQAETDRRRTASSASTARSTTATPRADYGRRSGRPPALRPASSRAGRAGSPRGTPRSGKRERHLVFSPSAFVEYSCGTIRHPTRDRRWRPPSAPKFHETFTEALTNSLPVRSLRSPANGLRTPAHHPRPHRRAPRAHRASSMNWRRGFHVVFDDATLHRHGADAAPSDMQTAVPWAELGSRARCRGWSVRGGDILRLAAGPCRRQDIWRALGACGPLVVFALVPFAVGMSMDSLGTMVILGAMGRRTTLAQMLPVRIASEALHFSLPGGFVASDAATALLLLQSRSDVPIADGVVALIARKWLVMRAHAIYIAVGALMGLSALAQLSHALGGGRALPWAVAGSSVIPLVASCSISVVLLGRGTFVCLTSFLSRCTRRGGASLGGGPPKASRRQRRSSDAPPGLRARDVAGDRRVPRGLVLRGARVGVPTSPGGRRCSAPRGLRRRGRAVARPVDRDHGAVRAGRHRSRLRHRSARVRCGGGGRGGVLAAQARQGALVDRCGLRCARCDARAAGGARATGSRGGAPARIEDAAWR